MSESPAPAALTLQSLPLFPLGTVLFPGGQLPLRIFEVRYLDMIRRCERTGAPQEQFAAVGTLAHLTQVESPQAGLMLIQAEGRQRFRIQRSEQLPHGLWVADVELLADDVAVTVPDDLQETSTALHRVLDTLTERARASGAQLPVGEPWRLRDCGWVANRWCELLPLPTELRQRLMELDNPLLRLELVGDLLARHRIA